MDIFIAPHIEGPYNNKFDHVDIESAFAELSVLLKKKGVKDIDIEKIYSNIISLLV